MIFTDLLPRGLREPGLALKFGIITGITLVCLLSIASLITLSLQRTSLDDLLVASEAVVDDMAAAQVKANRDSEKIKVEQLLKLLTQIAPAAIANFDFTGLLNYTQTATEDPDISYVAIINSKGKTLASSGNLAKVAEGAKLEARVVYEGETLGKVILGYNHIRSQKQIDEANENARHNLADITLAKDKAFSSLVTSQTVLTLLVILLAVVVIYYIAHRVTKPLEIAIKLVNQIADGDLSADIKVTRKDETGQLLMAMKVMLTNLQNMVSKIGEATSQLGNTAGQISDVTEDTTIGAKQQQIETDQLANAIVEMTASAKEVETNSTEAAYSAQNADEEANNSKQVVNQAIDLINSLAKDIESAANVIQELKLHSEEIGTVLDVIRGIAEQTNLLALNAAIEAARAGEQGRGFAVVADEVRNLAGKTQQSTQEIQNTIERLQKGAGEAVTVMEQCQDKAHNGVSQAAKAGDSLNEITQAISNISDMNLQIANSAKEQSQVTEELAKSVTKISGVASQTSESAQVTSNSSEELNKLSTGLLTLVNMFKA
ncbi:MAG: methyl-accepting chemotaxis protein [Gammaproteobacteria bacterium]